MSETTTPNVHDLAYWNGARERSDCELAPFKGIAGTDLDDEQRARLLLVALHQIKHLFDTVEALALETPPVPPQPPQQAPRTPATLNGPAPKPRKPHISAKD